MLEDVATDNPVEIFLEFVDDIEDIADQHGINAFARHRGSIGVHLDPDDPCALTSLECRAESSLTASELQDRFRIWIDALEQVSAHLSAMGWKAVHIGRSVNGHRMPGQSLVRKCVGREEMVGASHKNSWIGGIPADDRELRLNGGGNLLRHVLELGEGQVKLRRDDPLLWIRTLVCDRHRG